MTSLRVKSSLRETPRKTASEEEVEMDSRLATRGVPESEFEEQVLDHAQDLSFVERVVD